MNKLEKELKILSETLRTARAPNRARVESPIGPTKEDILVINSPEDVMVLVLRCLVGGLGGEVSRFFFFFFLKGARPAFLLCWEFSTQD